ncbi:MAG TPA: TetM/TetW/TetO/TetS family tetracycline resistance ribosomal protection protein [Oscillospiraceae bacterium]|nr:TetM/TetW/TetO/TetS family tetracycline resistance ribosomal protection protein [Oscillospiraceae bacterium]
MKKIIAGILAHVDAGKTTLAEAMLYRTGKLRKIGRVDHGDTALDTHALERERGITIFASQAVFSTDKMEVTLLDTPGHVDFSSETERTLGVLDYAILVISGLDGVQSHTLTLWKLLRLYSVPTFVFVTKMDFARKSREEIIENLNSELDGEFVDFGDEAAMSEGLALCSESMMEKYLGGETIDEREISEAIKLRQVFPCFFGSGLKLDGIDEFIDALEKYTIQPEYSEAFGAKVFKISHDPQGVRLTHIKVTGGSIKVREMIGDEKISGIRIYSGAKFTTADEGKSGEICALTGLDKTHNGQGLGFEAAGERPTLEPVMNYRVVLPDECDADTILPKLRELEEEDPQLHVTWNSHLKEIHVGLMGDVQAEILKSIVAERFGVKIDIDSGRVMYKETIENKVEGIGHYEPLRHYAEVHLIMEPLPRDSGLVFRTDCSEDTLDRNWQRLILMHLGEKQHLGVLTGSPITDMRITLAAGRAHIKHTEGGDFRQATYRAVRQGLMQAKSKLLEPYFSFRLEVPSEQIGRAINDIRMRSGSFDSPEESGGISVLRGRAPVTELNGYASEVAAYTGGRGRLYCESAGYDDCHNAEKVIAELAYDPEADLENTPDSVFCAHGGGFGVKWNKVGEYMHLESCLEKEKPYTPPVNRRNLHIDDKELEAIMEREFGKPKYELYRPTAKKNDGNQTDFEMTERKSYVLVDGYNVIFAWDELKSLADTDLGAARERLMEILCNYSAYTKNNVVLVFDAYKVPGNTGERFDFHNIHVVYTKERELGDVYIEKLISEIGKNDRVRVVTSDNLIQLSAVRFGVLRMSAAEFEREVDSVHAKIGKFLDEIREKNPKTKIDEIVK